MSKLNVILKEKNVKVFTQKKSTESWVDTKLCFLGWESAGFSYLYIERKRVRKKERGREKERVRECVSWNGGGWLKDWDFS